MNIFNFLKPKTTQPTIESYGQLSSGVEEQQIQSVMEWLFASLLNAGYFGKSHLIWYNSDRDNLDTSVEPEIKKAMRRDEPVFLYRCCGRASLPPSGYYWRMMEEHPSMRIYQLEVNQD